MFFDLFKRELFQKDILYIESDGNYCMINTRRGKIKSHVTITEIERKLQKKYFSRCHRSFVVNLLYIKNMDVSSVQMKNDVIIPISRGKRRGIQESYIDFLCGN